MKTFLRFLFSSQKRYYQLQKQSNIQIGDLVYVKNPSKSFENYWPGIWVKKLDEYVGSYCVVNGITKQGIRIANMKYLAVPYHILEKIY